MELEARMKDRKRRRGRSGEARVAETDECALELPEISKSCSSDSNPSSTIVDSCSSAYADDCSLYLGRSDSCGGPDEEKLSSTGIIAQRSAKVTGLEVDRRKEGKEDEDEDGTVLDPEKHSFSLALRGRTHFWASFLSFFLPASTHFTDRSHFSPLCTECQNRHFRLQERRRWPASFDFSSQGNHAPISSPRSYIARGSMKKNGSMSAGSSTFPSPGAPIYRQSLGAAGGPKGWSSERVPLTANPGRRYGSGSLLTPFGNGKALPSKWEDAEKWILSPVSGDGFGLRNPPLPPHYRRPKSKSGPLGSPSASGPYSITSPLSHGFRCRRIQNYAANSPLMTGVLVADRGCCGHDIIGRREGGNGDGEVRSCSAQSGHCVVRSASMNGWSELMDSSSSLPSSRDEKYDCRKDISTTSLPAVSMKDMATQMSPDCSPHSSPSKRPYSSPPSPSPSNATEAAQSRSLESEVRDVQVDVPVTVTRWSKKQVSRGLDRDPASIMNCKKTTICDSMASDWESSDMVKCMSKLNREEAKIAAWENLQKVKAEEAIQKLEMKLEKKRSSSMDKILNKLKSAERKAQEMRNTKVTSGQSHEGDTTNKGAALSHRTGRISSFSSCFTCHVF